MGGLTIAVLAPAFLTAGLLILADGLSMPDFLSVDCALVIPPVSKNAATGIMYFFIPVSLIEKIDTANLGHSFFITGKAKELNSGLTSVNKLMKYQTGCINGAPAKQFRNYNIKMGYYLFFPSVRRFQQ
jgi:hypothetical protein